MDRTSCLLIGLRGPYLEEGEACNDFQEFLIPVSPPWVIWNKEWSRPEETCPGAPAWPEFGVEKQNLVGVLHTEASFSC